MPDIDWLNRLGKWRTVFAGWQLGTRQKGDPESDAVRDHREATMMLRAEISALTALLVRKGVLSERELTHQIHNEAKYLCECFERHFDGFKAADDGMVLDATKAAETMRGWRP